MPLQAHRRKRGHSFFLWLSPSVTTVPDGSESAKNHKLQSTSIQTPLPSTPLHRNPSLFQFSTRWCEPIRSSEGSRRREPRCEGAWQLSGQSAGWALQQSAAGLEGEAGGCAGSMRREKNRVLFIMADCLSLYIPVSILPFCLIPIYPWLVFHLCPSGCNGVSGCLDWWKSGCCWQPRCTNIYSFKSPKTRVIALRPAGGLWHFVPNFLSGFRLIFLTPSCFSVQPGLLWFLCSTNMCRLGTSSSNLTGFNRPREKQLPETHACAHACKGAGPSAEVGSRQQIPSQIRQVTISATFQHMFNSSAKFSFHIYKRN